MPTHPDGTRGLRVLIVEDEALIAEELRERLTRLGLVVVGTADTGEMALEVATRTHPELVLMDVRLNGQLDGVDAAGDLRRRVDVPVLFLTAHSDRATLDRAKATAPYGYVLKPFQERELIVAIEMAVHRHTLERTLKVSERRYVSTLASIGDGVIATDIDGSVTFMNPVAEALSGWTLEHARGLPVDRVFQVAQDVSGSPIVRPIGQALAEGQALRFGHTDLFLVSRNNEMIPIDDSAAPIVDDRGRVLGGVVVFRDVRDRRLAEDALRRAQEELVHAQKMETVGRLAAGIAHDFNNLLTVINGCSELALGSDHLDATTRELLQDVVKAGGRAASLTRQFLAFGRKQRLEPRVVDVPALVADLAPMLRRLIREDVQLTVTSDASSMLVLADPGQLEQVIVNLAVNARDAMPGGGTLTMATAHTTVDAATLENASAREPGRYVVFTVTDTGHGMDQAKRQMFDPYFTSKEFGKGSGLGLATVYGIVKQFGGFIEVDSEPGRGTAFSIHLPIVEDAAATSRFRGAASQTADPGGETILLVEDELAVRTLLGTVLRWQCYTVIEASDGESALRAFEERGPIDLIITDVLMPGLTGPAATTRLRALGRHLRVLYIADDSSNVVSLASGVAFMQSPSRPMPFPSRFGNCSIVRSGRVKGRATRPSAPARQNRSLGT